MILDIDGTTTSPILESLMGNTFACKKIFIDTLVVHVTGNSTMMHQLHYWTKPMDHTLKNWKTTG